MESKISEEGERLITELRYDAINVGEYSNGADQNVWDTSLLESWKSIREFIARVEHERDENKEKIAELINAVVNMQRERDEARAKWGSIPEHFRCQECAATIGRDTQRFVRYVAPAESGKDAE